MASLPVFNAAQNAIIDLAYPIWRLFGTTISKLGLSAISGSIYAKFYLPSFSTKILQNPSLISALENKIGTSRGTFAIVYSILGRVSPVYCKASSGAIHFILLLTEGICSPCIFMLNNRSCMILYTLILCGIVAIGETLSWGGYLFFISLYLNMV